MRLGGSGMDLALISSSPSGELPVSDPVLFAGPTLLGALFAYTLFGVLLVQIAQYYQCFASDRLWQKLLVAVVVVIQGLQLGFTTNNAWNLCVLGLADSTRLRTTPATGAATNFLNGSTALCVQGYFAWRIYRLAKGRKLLIGATWLAALALVQWGSSIALIVGFIRLNRQVDLVPVKLRVPVTLYFMAAAVRDVVISISMTFILSRYKTKTAFAETKSLLNTLIATTVENGIITTVSALINLVIYFTRTHDLIGVAIQYVIGGIYASVLLATLNRRSPLAQTTDGSDNFLPDAAGFVRSRHKSVRGPTPSYQVNYFGRMDNFETELNDNLYKHETASSLGGDRSVMVCVSKEVHEDVDRLPSPFVTSLKH
ncbi:hypothetical protein DFP72DRAFT_927744 [Ephemerocybe angulata]|uniref:DUF6534 domain-containing protein n=1 Tax=Ephemerocybe angulata TaxID=980116 RepID=A0A8H6HFA0_9AGAR|nr:hypothetical protein DFP72DRAFT_927744 [Tulosesus angulatus]